MKSYFHETEKEKDGSAKVCKNCEHKTASIENKLQQKLDTTKKRLVCTADLLSIFTNPICHEFLFLCSQTNFDSLVKNRMDVAGKQFKDDLIDKFKGGIKDEPSI